LRTPSRISWCGSPSGGSKSIVMSGLGAYAGAS
jgi:hypothetical protein